MLAVVIAPRGEDTYYVVTARPADRGERRRHEQEKGSE
jgi:CopG antitoxin of type II toxin-antitoxin system